MGAVGAALLCEAPPSTAGSLTLADVRVSLNAQQYVLNRENASFTYYDAPRVAEISPTSGPMSGGTLVNVSGTGFALGSHYVRLRRRCGAGDGSIRTTE